MLSLLKNSVFLMKCVRLRLIVSVCLILRLMTPSYLYFSEKEFNSLTPSCSLSDMNESFMNKLDLARSLAGIPFVLNCAYRSFEWDQSKGRSGLSYHCYGRAVDIRCFDSENRFKIIKACLVAGLKVGIYKNFLHVDNRVEDIIFIGDKTID